MRIRSQFGPGNHRRCHNIARQHQRFIHFCDAGRESDPSADASTIQSSAVADMGPVGGMGDASWSRRDPKASRCCSRARWSPAGDLLSALCPTRSSSPNSQRRTGIAFDVIHGDVGDASDAVRQIPDQPPGQSTRQCRDHDTVEVLLVEQLPGSVDRQGVDDLSAGLDPGSPQPGELMLQPALGQRPGDPVRVGDEPIDRGESDCCVPSLSVTGTRNRNALEPALTSSSSLAVSCSPPIVWLATMR